MQLALRPIYKSLAVVLLASAGGSVFAANRVKPVGKRPPAWAAEGMDLLSRIGIKPEVPTQADSLPPRRFTVAVLFWRIQKEQSQDAQKASERMKSTGLARKHVGFTYLLSQEALTKHTWKRLEKLIQDEPPRGRDYQQTQVEYLDGRPFRDLHASHPAYDAVMQLAQRGVFTGDDNDCFRGDQRVMLNELAAIIYRYTQIPTHADKEMWWSEARDFLDHSGVPFAVPKDARGKLPSRYQFAVMLQRAMVRMNRDLDADILAAHERIKKDPSLRAQGDLPPYLQSDKLARWIVDRLDVPTSYGHPPKQRAALKLGLPIGTDARIPPYGVPEDHPARDAVTQLCQRGIFTGYADGTFRGDYAVSPGEFAVSIVRVAQDILRITTREPGPGGKIGPEGGAF